MHRQWLLRALLRQRRRLVLEILVACLFQRELGPGQPEWLLNAETSWNEETVQTFAF